MNIYFESILPNFGFDGTASPQWLMVPHREAQPIWLVNGADCTITSRSPAIATVSVDNENRSLITRQGLNSMTINQIPERQILRIRGNAPGRTFIEVRQGKQLIKLLEVSVKSPITLKLSFHFVSDNANHSTKRTPEELKDLISILNQIVTPQTNIIFQKKNHFLLKFNRDLGDAVNYNMDYQAGRPMKGHEFDLVTSKRDSSAHINIFFVWENEFIDKTQQGKLIKSGALGYSAGGRDILIEDWNGLMDRDNDNKADNFNSPAWENARMLAHEIGHVLGIADITKTRKVRNFTTNHIERIAVNANYIMGSGPFIPKNHANIMSAIARQIEGK